MKFELDLSNYATISDLKGTTEFELPKFKGTVMQIEKALINNNLLVSKTF